MLERTDILKIFENWSTTMIQKRDELIALDSVVGDGDLGLTMSDGFKAAYANMAESSETDLGKLIYFGGKAMSTAVPSTMGTLMSYGMMSGSKAIKGAVSLDLEGLAKFLEGYYGGIQSMGKAQLGEKTILDSFGPAVTAFRTVADQTGDLTKAVVAAAEAAQVGFDQTTEMVAKHGRAATRGEASRGLQDPGAAVAVLLMKTLAATLTDRLN